MKKSFLSVLIFHSLLFTVSAQKPELIIPIGHTADILTCCYSPDGNYILSGGCDNIMILWEISSGKQIRVFSGHSNFITYACFSPDGKQIVSCSDDGTAKLWDVATTQELFTFHAKSANFTKACFSKNGQRLVLCEEGYNVYLFDLPSKKIVWEELENKAIYGPLNLQFALNETKIFIACPNSFPMLFDIADNSMVYAGEHNGIAIMFPDGERMISTSGIFNLKGGTIIPGYADAPFLKGQQISDLVMLDDWGYSAAISSDEKSIFVLESPNSSSGQNSILRWNKNDTCSLSKTFELSYSYKGDSIITDTIFSNRLNYLYIQSPNSIENYSTEEKIFCMSISSKGDTYATGGSDNILRLYDIESGKLIRELKSHSTHVNAAIFSPDGNTITQGSTNKTIKLWKFRNKVELENINTDNPVHSLCYSRDGKRLLTLLFKEGSESFPQYDYFAEWNVQDHNIIRDGGTKILFETLNKRGNYPVLQPIGNLIKSLLYIPGEKDILCLQNFNILSIIGDTNCSYFKFKTGNKIILKKTPDAGKYDDFTVSVGNNYLAYRKKDHFFQYDNLPRKIDSPYDAANKAVLSPDGKQILTGSDQWRMKFWDIASMQEIKSFKTSSEFVTAVAFSPDGFSCLSGGGGSGTIELWDTRTNKRIRKIEGHNGFIINLEFSPDGKTFLCNSQDNSIKLYDVATGTLIYTLTGHVRWPSQVSFSPDGKKLLSGSVDNTMKLWDAEAGKEVATLISIDTSDWVITTPDMYYFTSKGALDLMGWKMENKVYNFDQFDLQYNRPDIVLERIGLTDSALINAYRKAYYKRLNKMKFDEGMFSPEFHMPKTSILDSGKFAVITDYNNQILKVKFTDSKYNLDRINVWVNEVPVFGTNGIDLRPLSADSIVKDIPVDLERGENKIQVSCLNEKGVESYKEIAWVKYEPKDTVISNLYVVSISVSNYKNTQYNLKYAAKDGHDIAHLFIIPHEEGLRGVTIDTLFNSSATKENILALKQKLMQTQVDDEVILYVSGHGLLDKNYDFYFATYDMNFENPAEHGILYDDLEGLLDGIPARKKLLLMDACHSGEVDKEEIEVKDTSVILADGHKGDIKTYGYKGIQLDKQNNSGLGLQNSFELMQELFANLTRGSGAVVISAAAGTGLALESPEWNNGVFTYCILNGLKNLAADANGDKMVNVNELKDYVSSEVERLTNGAQKPTSRRESLEFDWRVW